MRTKNLFGAGTLVVLLSIFGCNLASLTSSTETVNDSPLVGTWKWVSTTDKSASGDSTVVLPGDFYSYKYVLNGDYSLSMPMNLLGSSVTYRGKWSEAADSVTITVSDTGSGTKWGYAITGVNLVLSRKYVNQTSFNTMVERYTKQ